MRSWLSVLITDAKSKKGSDIPIAPSLYSLSNKMDNSLLAVRDINHKYIVVKRIKFSRYDLKKNPVADEGRYVASSLVISHGDFGYYLVLFNAKFF
jgi:hypothetical protein